MKSDIRNICCIWNKNKHTESIAKAIQVPHRPQQIQICNHYVGAFFKKKYSWNCSFN